MCNCALCLLPFQGPRLLLKSAKSARNRFPQEMAGFPLFDLNNSHLEKVFRKIELKNYLRLQQTCRGVKDFCWNNRNITIPSDDSFFIILGKREPLFTLIPSTGFLTQEVSSEDLAAACLRTFYLPNDAKTIEPLYNVLEEFRITCGELIVPDEAALTKEECVTLFNVLKPAAIQMGSWDSDRFEALFLCKRLNSIVLRLGADSIVSAMEYLLSICQNVDIRGSLQYTDQMQLIRTVLKILVSRPWPKLHNFNLCVPWQPVTEFDKEEVAKQLDGIKLKSLEKQADGTLEAWLDLPPHFPPEASCKFLLRSQDFIRTSISFVRD